MNCTLCDSQVSQCAVCRTLSCATVLCSRCAAAQPDAHPITVESGPVVSLGEPVPVSMDW